MAGKEKIDFQLKFKLTILKYTETYKFKFTVYKISMIRTFLTSLRSFQIN